MEAYSRDLLRGVGGGDDGEKKVQRLESQGEEVELSLGLSLGGRFGQERRRGEGLARSSSVACIQEVAQAPPALARTNSLPTMADAEAGNNTPSLRSGAEVQPSATPQRSGFPLNSIKEEPVAMLRASLCPSPGSSDGQGILTRTSSLPAGVEDGWRKRKVAQTLQWLKAKRRIERMNYSNVSVAGVGENPKVERMNHSNVKHRSSGLPPPYQPPVTSQGTPSALERSLSSAVVPSSEGGNSNVVATASSAPAVRAAALGISIGEQQDGSERPAARATRSMGDVERRMVPKMPLVYTSGLPNSSRIEGFLYKYSKVDEVRIMCVCHGSFLTPAEFVAHAGGSEVAHPMRHIVVNTPSSL